MTLINYSDNIFANKTIISVATNEVELLKSIYMLQ